MAERLIALGGFKVRRCHACDLRFATIGTSLLMISDVQKILRTALFIMLMGAALAIVLVAVLWFSDKQAAPSPPDNGAGSQLHGAVLA